MVKRAHLLAMCGLAVLIAACGADQGVELESRSIQLEQTAEPAGISAAPESIRGVVQQTGPTYVTLTVSKIDKEASRGDRKERAVTSGSGFVVDRTGFVVTAAHVAVQKGYSVSARAANGRIYSGKVVEVLPGNDMALIKLRGYAGKAVKPASQACVARGSLVYSLGKPHAQGDTARVGTLEAMHFGRAVQYGNFGYPDAMVLRMNTQKGESGGPVFDQSGQLIGMVVSTLSDGNGRPLNMGHAVPATRIASFFCGNASCPGDWAQLASRSTDNCPNS
jgi:S1-C subfamily serine protease